MRSPARLISAACLFVLLAAGCRGDLSDPCTEDADCGRGLTCWPASVFQVNTAGGQCSLTCDGPADCPDEGTCLNGLCALKCDGATDPACGDGTTCFGGRCVLTCMESTDCKALSFCPAPGGICEPEPEG